jgi:group II intron reverse transcriptase/maturase
LNAVYEAEFKGFSYGFRPGRSPHSALDAVDVGIHQKRVNWVLDADIRGFFDHLDHRMLVAFVEHRIADTRVIRHIKKWLRAGVLEDGVVHRVDEGTPQGGSISPLLANIYLHYAFDMWIDHWRRHHARGDIIVVRYADDFVIGCEHREEAERLHAELADRLATFHLELHETKTRLIEFGRDAATNRRRRGEGKPETFDFLGFTHICGRTRKGRFTVRRITARKKMRSKLNQIKGELRKRLNRRVPENGAYLKMVLLGHYRYYGVPGNWQAMSAFQYHVLCRWYAQLNRRSQRRGVTATRMARYAKRWLPNPRLFHPYPSQRLCVRT